MIIWIYKQPLALIAVLIILIPIIRGLIGNVRKWISIILFCISITSVLYVTIFTRSQTDRVFEWRLLYLFVLAQRQPEVYRSILMNVFLFVPIGLFFPFMLKKNNILWTVALALLFSILIEATQFYCYLGRAEMDDVICNAFGAFIGATSWRVYKQHWNDKIREVIAVFRNK